MLKIFANILWIHTPNFLQKKFSNLFSRIFSMGISRYFIVPYCLFFNLTADYLDQFESESSGSNYTSYSEFFKRKYKVLPQIKSDAVWPCEGNICDRGFFADKNKSFVKSQAIDLNKIFNSRHEVTESYYFLNIFLHNHNYHRVHSPISGRISKITSIPGDLIFLRPWFFNKGDASYPAFRNERVIFEIRDYQNRPWYLAMVGGFGVGSIEILNEFKCGGAVIAGQEIAKFNLGSTVCIASPNEIETVNFFGNVVVGEELKTKKNSHG